MIFFIKSKTAIDNYFAYLEKEFQIIDMETKKFLKIKTSLKISILVKMIQ